MTVVSTNEDKDALTLTIVSELEATPDRVWEVWSDPRQLERWWGPPTWPATFEEHDVQVGGLSSYFMTGPEGEKARGWWRILLLEEHRTIEFEDGFSGEDGVPDYSMPVTRAKVELEKVVSGTRMTITSTFATAEEMEKLSKMGMVEGITAALNQIDAVLTG